jgi:protein-S-isoprenylcysteine O-methyltransferase Ste14
MASEPPRTWRDVVFKNRGTLLALPAVALALFGRPSRASAAVGVPIALAGEALRCWAVGYSGVTTRADHVTAPQLVTAGPYARVRNPLYVGNFITALGFTLAFTGRLSPARRVLVLLASLGTMFGVYAAIVPLEEAYLRATFGAAFEAYAADVPRLLPLGAPASTQAGTYDPSVIVRAESRTFVTFGAMLGALAIRAFSAGAR